MGRQTPRTHPRRRGARRHRPPTPPLAPRRPLRPVPFGVKGCRSSPRARNLKGLGLDLIVLALADGSGVEQRLGRRDLVSGAARTCVGGGDRPDVFLLALLRVGLRLEPALGHAIATSDQVNERAHDRQDDDEERPQRLRPTAEVPAAEEVPEDPEQTHEPGDEDEKLEQRQQERAVVVEHVSTLPGSRPTAPAAKTAVLGLPFNRTRLTPASSATGDLPAPGKRLTRAVP